MLALSSLSFDLSVFDIFGTLAAGARGGHAGPGAGRRPGALAGAGARPPGQRLELGAGPARPCWSSTPRAARNRCRRRCGWRCCPATGSRSRLPDRFRRLLPGCQLHSLGGATEASIWSIHHPIGEVDPGWRSIPYGRALRHQQFHVLDAALRPRPTWAAGELYIGGIGLAQGYWRDSEQTTAASFIAHPVTGERLYRTGDLGRLLPDGTIEFLGREDGQVKIHGYRVELGEIEAALEAHPAVAGRRGAGVRRRRTATSGWPATWCPPRSGRRGCARAQRWPASLTRHLAGKLPGYMVPATFTLLDALPLSANGKLDRVPAARARRPAGDRAGTPSDGQALASPAEQRLVASSRRCSAGTGIALPAPTCCSWAPPRSTSSGSATRCPASWASGRSWPS